MTFSKQFSLFTKAILPISIVFLAYGYLCRLAEIYFFWESRSIGWTLFFIGCIGFLIDRIRVKTLYHRKTVFEKTALIFAIIGFTIKIIFISIIPVTDAFAATKVYVKTDPKLQMELGAVKGIALFPVGTVIKGSGKNGVMGSATFMMTIIGDRKFKDVTVYVVKYVDSTSWKVEEMD